MEAVIRSSRTSVRTRLEGFKAQETYESAYCFHLPIRIALMTVCCIGIGITYTGIQGVSEGICHAERQRSLSFSCIGITKYI
jgi:hypothetical protein